MARNLVQICNEAISDLPAHPIVDMDDTAKEARECSRHLPGVVSDLIGLHDWSFVRRRIAIASLTNSRDAEWGYAYALPDEYASAVRLVPDYGSSTGVDVVVTPMLYWPSADLTPIAFDYEIADGVLYTNLENVTLEYSTDAIEPNKWPALFAQAVIRTLASRIYRPILGEKADTREWLMKSQAAERAVNEAKADDLNRNPRRSKSFTSQAEIARGSVYGGAVWRR